MSQMEVLKNYVFKEEEENFTKHFYISAMTTCTFYLCIHHFSHLSLTLYKKNMYFDVTSNQIWQDTLIEGF